MARLLIILVIAVVAAVLLVFAMGPRLSEARVERINRRLIALRDRAISNSSDTNALNTLMASMHSRNSFERNAAIALLGQIGPNAKPSVPLLIAALGGSDAYDSREAARSLGQIGAAAKESIPALTKAVHKYPNADIGWFAADSLAVIADPNDITVIETLEDATKSSDPRMAEHASSSLATLSQRRAKSLNQ